MTAVSFVTDKIHSVPSSVRVFLFVYYSFPFNKFTNYLFPVDACMHTRAQTEKHIITAATVRFSNVCVKLSLSEYKFC